MALQNSINLAITATEPLEAVNGGLGVSNPTAHGILVAEGSNPAVALTLNDGQLLIGATGSDPVAASVSSPNGTVTVTSGAGSLALDINTVDVSHGGTGLTNTTQNALFFGNGTSPFGQFLLAPGQFAFGSTGGSPSYGSLTSTDSSVTVTVGANSLDLSLGTVSVAHGGTGATSFPAHSLLVGNGTSALTSLSLTDGQVLVGSSGNNPVPATLTAGAGISITNAAGAITINATGMANWTPQSSSTTMIAEGSYIANSSSLITFTLPATANVGDEFEITGVGTGLYVIAQNAGQYIRYGNKITTTGAAGTVVSKTVGDSIRIVCVAANNGFQVLSSQGFFDVL